MKTEGFVKLLRKVIREEVRNVIKAELKPILNEVKNKKHDISLHDVMLSDDTPKQSVAKKQFVKDPILNEMLNQTAATPSSQEASEWATMNFRSEMAQAMGMNNGPAGMQPLASSGINGEAVDMSNKEVAKTVDNMTKDYSALMKAINKKKGI